MAIDPATNSRDRGFTHTHILSEEPGNSSAPFLLAQATTATEVLLRTLPNGGQIIQRGGEILVRMPVSRGITPPPVGSGGTITQIGVTALALLARVFLTSEGELNVLKLQGQIADYVSLQDMRMAGSAITMLGLDSATMAQDWTPEQKSQFIVIAAGLYEAFENNRISEQQFRQAVRGVFNDIGSGRASGSGTATHPQLITVPVVQLPPPPPPPTPTYAVPVGPYTVTLRSPQANSAAGLASEYSVLYTLNGETRHISLRAQDLANARAELNSMYFSGRLPGLSTVSEEAQTITLAGGRVPVNIVTFQSGNQTVRSVRYAGFDGRVFEMPLAATSFSGARTEVEQLVQNGLLVGVTNREDAPLTLPGQQSPVTVSRVYYANGQAGRTIRYELNYRGQDGQQYRMPIYGVETLNGASEYVWRLYNDNRIPQLPRLGQSSQPLLPGVPERPALPPADPNAPPDRILVTPPPAEEPNRVLITPPPQGTPPQPDEGGGGTNQPPRNPPTGGGGNGPNPPGGNGGAEPAGNGPPQRTRVFGTGLEDDIAIFLGQGLVNLISAGTAAIHYQFSEKRTSNAVTPANVLQELAALQQNPDSYLRSNYTNSILGLDVGDNLYNLTGRLFEMEQGGRLTYFRRVPDDIYQNLLQRQQANGINSDRVFVNELIDDGNGNRVPVWVEIRAPVRREGYQLNTFVNGPTGNGSNFWDQWDRGGTAGFTFGVDEGYRIGAEVTFTFDPTSSGISDRIRIAFPTSSQPAGIGYRTQNTTTFLRASAAYRTELNGARVRDITAGSSGTGLEGRIVIGESSAYLVAGQRSRNRIDITLPDPTQSFGAYARMRETSFLEFGPAAVFFGTDDWNLNYYHEWQFYPNDLREQVNLLPPYDRGTGLQPSVLNAPAYRFRAPSMENDVALQLTFNDRINTMIALRDVETLNEWFPVLTERLGVDGALEAISSVIQPENAPAPPATRDAIGPLRVTAGGAGTPAATALSAQQDRTPIQLADGTRAELVTRGNQRFLVISGQTDVFDVTNVGVGNLRVMAYQPGSLVSTGNFILDPAAQVRLPAPNAPSRWNALADGAPSPQMLTQNGRNTRTVQTADGLSLTLTDLNGRTYAVGMINGQRAVFDVTGGDVQRSVFVPGSVPSLASIDAIGVNGPGPSAAEVIARGRREVLSDGRVAFFYSTGGQDYVLYRSRSGEMTLYNVTGYGRDTIDHFIQDLAVLMGRGNLYANLPLENGVVSDTGVLQPVARPNRPAPPPPPPPPTSETVLADLERELSRGPAPRSQIGPILETVSQILQKFPGKVAEAGQWLANGMTAYSVVQNLINGLQGEAGRITSLITDGGRVIPVADSLQLVLSQNGQQVGYMVGEGMALPIHAPDEKIVAVMRGPDALQQSLAGLSALASRGIFGKDLMPVGQLGNVVFSGINTANRIGDLSKAMDLAVKSGNEAVIGMTRAQLNSEIAGAVGLGFNALGILGNNNPTLRKISEIGGAGVQAFQAIQAIEGANAALRSARAAGDAAKVASASRAVASSVVGAVGAGFGILGLVAGNNKTLQDISKWGGALSGVALAALTPTPLGIVGGIVGLLSAFGIFGGKPKVVKLTDKLDVTGDGSNDKVSFQRKKDDYYYDVKTSDRGLNLKSLSFKLDKVTVFQDTSAEDRRGRWGRKSEPVLTNYIAPTPRAQRFGRRSEEYTPATGERYFISLTADYESLFPGVTKDARVSNTLRTRRERDGGGEYIQGGIEITKEQYEQLLAAHGAQGKIGGGNSEAIKSFRPFINQLGTVRFEQSASGEGMNFYLDVNGDGILDRVQQYMDLRKAGGPSYKDQPQFRVNFRDEAGRETMQLAGNSLEDISKASMLEPYILAYVASHHDLIGKFGTDIMAALPHFLAHAETKGISFDAVTYLLNNPDLLRAFGSDMSAAARHYITHGFRENRDAGSLPTVETFLQHRAVRQDAAGVLRRLAILIPALKEFAEIDPATLTPRQAAELLFALVTVAPEAAPAILEAMEPGALFAAARRDARNGAASGGAGRGGDINTGADIIIANIAREALRPKNQQRRET